VGLDSSVNRPCTRQDGAVNVVLAPLNVKSDLSIAIGRYTLGTAEISARKRLSTILDKVVQEENIDVVDSYDWSGPLWSKPPCPLVVRMHGANTACNAYEGRPVSRVLRFFESRNLRLADSLIAVSEHNGTLTLDSCGLSRLAFRVIYNGCDVQRFRPLAIEKDDCEVLYVGGATERKGVPDLLRSLPLVCEVFPQFHLSMICKSESPQIAGWVNTLPSDVRSRVRILGRRPNEELPLHYSRAAVTVIPSRVEACPLVCLEAMSCGAAIVMSSLACGSELVNDGIDGRLVDPRSPRALAQAICSLLKDRGTREWLGRSARRRILNDFDIRQLAHINLAHYRTLCDSQKVSATQLRGQVVS